MNWDTNNLPFISVVTPVYNSEAVIRDCLDAIAIQNYPKDKMEVILPDAGSKDNTVEIIKTYQGQLNIVIAENPLKTGEAGKAVGVDISKGEIIALIDSDNIMPDENFVMDMVAPFLDDPEIIGTEPLYFKYRKKDKPLTKYFASAGINDPLCLFIGNYDRYSYITGKWTGFRLNTVENDRYITIDLDEKHIPTIGANGTFLKREYLMRANYKPYLFDIDVVYEILKSGIGKFVKVKTGIIHVYSPKLSSFIQKQHRRISDFMHFEKGAQRTYPWSKLPAGGIFVFSLYCITIIPLIIQGFIGFLRRPALYWLYHPVVCEITLFIYGFSFIKAKLTGKTGIKNRDNYKQ